MKDNYISDFLSVCVPLVVGFGFFVLYLVLTGSHSVVQVDFECVALLPQPPQCWDYRQEPHLAFVLLREIRLH